MIPKNQNKNKQTKKNNLTSTVHNLFLENAPDQSRKERAKSKKAANKVKRLDPTQHKRVTDIQDEMAAADQKAKEGGDEEEEDSSDESEDEGVHSAADSSGKGFPWIL